MPRHGRIEEHLLERAADFGECAVSMTDDMSNDWTTRHLGHQLMKSATSVGAHLREANRARTADEFTSKIGGALQEADETRHWLLMLGRTDRGDPRRLRHLYDEADQLLRILTATVKRVESDQ